MRAFICAGHFAFLICGVSGQDAPVQPTFEVASIKPNTSGATRGGVRSDPERLTGTNATLKQLVLFAYDLPEYRLTGPHWIETERYDVAAKAPASVTGEQMRLMLQTLLADRFHVTFHRETKVVPVYWLIAAKNGPKVRRLKEGDQLPAMRPGTNAMYMRATTPQFADRLSRYLERPVIDKTNLEGVFFFQLEWALDSVSEPTDSGASLFTAIQEQLGLKLDPHKSEVEFLVIDTVQKPTNSAQ